MNCVQCGAALKDGAVFCPHCGSKQPVSAAPPGGGYGATPGGSYGTNPGGGYGTPPGGGYGMPPGGGSGGGFLSKIPLFSNLNNTQKLIALGCVVVAFIMVIVLVASLFGGNSKKGAVKDYCKALEKADAGRLLKCVPKDVIKTIMDEEDISRRELEEEVQDYIDDYWDDDIDSIKVSFEDSEDLARGELRDLRDQYEDYFEIEIKDAVAYDVEVRVESDGGDNVYTDDDEFIVVKVGGSWYCTSALSILYWIY